MKAVNSIPAYVERSSHFFTICPGDSVFCVILAAARTARASRAARHVVERSFLSLFLCVCHLLSFQLFNTTSFLVLRAITGRG